MMRGYLQQIGFLLLNSTLWFLPMVGSPVVAQEDLVDFDYWASLCNTLGETEQLEEAMKACDKAVGLFPGDAEAWNDRGDILFKLERFAEALVSYEQALRQDPTNSFIQAKRCSTLVELGQTENAVTSCEESIEIDGDWGEDTPAIAWYNRGEALEQMGNISEALDSYDWATRINPSYSPGWAGRCSALWALSRYEEALVACDKAIQAGNWGLESPALAWLNRGRVLVSLAQFNEALDSYNQSLAINPENAVAWSEQGDLLGLLGRNTESLNSQEWALTLRPNYALALAHQCAALNRIGQYEEAAKACNKAIQEGDGRWGSFGAAYAWNQRGNAFIGQLRYEEGLASINRAISLKPDYAEAWINQSVALWLLERNAEALAATRNALDLNPQSSRAWFNQGRILVTLQSYEEAAEAYRQALAGDAYVGGVPKIEDIWVNLSATLWRLGRYGEAIGAAEEAIDLDPELALAWYNKGLSLMSSGQSSAAISAYETALELNPNDANTWLGLGIALRRIEDYAQAIAALQKALEFNPDLEIAQTNLEAVMAAMQGQQMEE
ncbi:tetratricopeptide repeat protein [Spirulina sp. CS-785/01]|uniref:tetratricopeptide repeat protein n=1 Tax=Spirulina sp. CS-785/01 TaxID=3021716 RepID=UPI00232B80AE|nr:tetratricopeptide repeat protein [Spirulina sp. CS-785/01]MDB9313308.1 tetratricopeptide repeat protein [Spirulina sp. CS-785/01]